MKGPKAKEPKVMEHKVKKPKAKEPKAKRKRPETSLKRFHVLSYINPIYPILL